MITKEQNIQINILNYFLNTSHKDIKDFIIIHNKMYDQDPFFYGHLAVWAQYNIGNRDHKNIFVAKLFISKFLKLREVGFVLIQNFSPLNVNRVIDNIKGKTTKTLEGKIYEERFGKNIPNIFKSAIKKYIKDRENKAELFDSQVLIFKKSIISIYTRVRIKPGNDHVRSILFGSEKNDLKFYSKPHKDLIKKNNSKKQIGKIIKNKNPFFLKQKELININSYKLVVEIMSKNLPKKSDIN